MCNLVTIAAALAIAAFLVGAPAPKEDKQTLYFPITSGSKWVYEDNEGKEHTEVVTATKKKAKEQSWVVSVGRIDEKEKVSPAAEWEVSDAGLLRISKTHNDKRLEEYYIKLPLKPNNKWDLLQGSGDFHCVALKAQRIKVPAGEFEAIGVEMYFAEELVRTRWYSLGVGLVKIEDKKKKTTLTLKSFTSGAE